MAGSINDLHLLEKPFLDNQNMIHVSKEGGLESYLRHNHTEQDQSVSPPDQQYQRSDSFLAYREKTTLLLITVYVGIIHIQKKNVVT